MSYILKIIDKSRRVITLSRERWSHIQEHPRMSGQIGKIEETLISPDVIKGFEYDEKVYFYYRYYKDAREYLLVLVKYLNGKGFIITSFFTDKIK